MPILWRVVCTGRSRVSGFSVTPVATSAGYREGRRGVCQVRYNAGGRLHVPSGYVAALQCDPTEKKPFFHVLPGSLTLTFGMLGCDLHCAYCQNWITA